MAVKFFEGMRSENRKMARFKEPYRTKAPARELLFW
jgi:hypothetical protein